MWVFAGLGAFAVARIIRAGRPMGWVLEASVALLTAAAAGVAATALDFGGWHEPDWRAGAFALALSFAAIGLTRVVRLVKR